MRTFAQLRTIKYRHTLIATLRFVMWEIIRITISSTVSCCSQSIYRSFDSLKKKCFQVYHIAHLRQQCHNSKFVLFQKKLLKFLKCYNFLWVQRRHNCSPAASFANCVMTLYLLKAHLQTFLSLPITQKCQLLSCDTLVANEWYIV